MRGNFDQIKELGGFRGNFRNKEDLWGIYIGIALSFLEIIFFCN